MTTQSNPALSAQHLPQLDGLRGIAILLVLVSHSDVHLRWLNVRWLQLDQAVNYGWTGVHLFFVLSGFLITGLLADSRAQPRYFLNFYARRALRIWPLYYGLIAFVYLVMPRMYPGAWEMRFDYPWQIYVFFIPNLMQDWGMAMLVVTWSLAVEEHFYVVWPVLVALFRGSSLRWLLWAVVIGCPLLRLEEVYAGTLRYAIPGLDGPDWKLIFTSTQYQLDGLAAGALIALWMRSPDFKAENLKRVGLGLSALGIPLMVASLLIQDDLGKNSVTSYSFLAMGFAGMLCMALAPDAPRWLLSLLKQPWLRYTGKISYCMYLIHLLVRFLFMDWLDTHLTFLLSYPRLRDITILVVWWALVYALATLSWYLLERPILSLKRYFEPRQSAVKVAVEAVPAQ